MKRSWPKSKHIKNDRGRAVNRQGNHYVSTDQDGHGNGVRARIQGHCNGYVAGQYGDENGAKANIAGAYNGVAMLQNGDDARARANVAGNDNGMASSRPSRGAEAVRRSTSPAAATASSAFSTNGQ